jgi:hypothetical protein
MMCSTLGRCLLASLPIALIGWFAQPWLAGLDHAPILLRAAALLIVIGGAALLFLIASWMLKIEGLAEFLGLVKRKLRIKS